MPDVCDHCGAKLYQREDDTEPVIRARYQKQWVEAAKPVLAKGRDAVVSIILDGENAWEYYPKSGREFLRRFYDESAEGIDRLVSQILSDIDQPKCIVHFRVLGQTLFGARGVCQGLIEIAIGLRH